jgi:diguanylate cyclase (GGDEF)-like protein/PAS domain S-box-containing protein
VTSWNAAAERMFGYPAGEVIGAPVAILAPPGATAIQEQVRARLMAGSPAEYLEATGRRKDGSLVEVLLTVSPATDESGRVVGMSAIAHDITTRRTAQRALEASERRLAEAQRIARLGSFELDLVTGAMTWSAEQYRLLGVDPSLPPSRELILSTVHPDDRAALEGAWADAIRRAASFDLHCRLVRPDGAQRWVHARVQPEVSDDGAVVKVAGTVSDETERIRADRVRRAAEARFEIGFEQAGIAVVILGLDGIPLRVNPAACVLLGRPEDQLVGRHWKQYAHPDEPPLWPTVLAMVAAGHESHTEDRRYLRPDGSVVWASARVVVVRAESGEPEYFLYQLQDITARKQLEQELAHQALHDALTGLPNRALLTDRLATGLARAERTSARLGVMFLDLDHFKMVNDSLGHTAGDEVLRRVARQIAAAVRTSDTVARFGGDEFVIVCDEATEPVMELIAERVLDSLRRPFRLGSEELTVTASLGIVIADPDATPESLLRDSDAAMYLSKERGRDRIERFDDLLRFKAERRLGTASALRGALDRDEFALHYQPVVDLITGRMVGAEALLRWQHPDLGMVSPAEFIPLAEDTGLIVPIGAWVLEQACRELVGWQRSDPAMTVAVNLSVRQMLDTDVTGLIAGVLDQTGIRPETLCLELTESVFMQDVDYFERTLAGIKKLDVRLAVDDFGTGYSSLSYLKRFPFDAVKVDRAFVDGLGTDPHDSALVAAVIAMAAALELQVTAEGVETHAQLRHLQQLRCGRAQGYYLARPMPATDLTQLVALAHRWQVD